MNKQETKKKKRIRRKVGDIIKIDLLNGQHAYAHVTTDPCIIFYDGRFQSNADITVEQIPFLPILFTLFVSNYAIKDGIWPVIAHAELEESLLRQPYMFKKDPISGRFYIYHADFEDTNYERPATFEECVGLECAAVWDPNHVVDRINDYYAGRPNQWAQQLALSK